MRYTQRLTACAGSLLLLGSLALLHAQDENRALPTNAESTRYVSQATIFAQQVEALDPNSVHDLYKIFVVLRCKDVPEVQRKALTLRILTGEYPGSPEFRWTAEPEQRRGLWVAALVALSHMHIDDASLQPFLEEHLPKWERLATVPDPELPTDLQRLKNRISPDVPMARALLARLKAVRAVPEVKSANDLERRLEVMLSEAGITHQELRQLLEEYKEKLRRGEWIAISPRAHLADHLVMEHARTLFHYAKRGMDLESVATSTDIEAFAKAVRLGETARDWSKLINSILQHRGYSSAPAQLLVDEGVAVVPVIIQKLTWAREHPKEIADTGMGVAVLLDVLATLIGKDALPLVELFLSDSNWAGRARRTKEWIEQGRVFGFNTLL
ncbi:hypothetical protein [Fervidobacterium sp.]